MNSLNQLCSIAGLAGGSNSPLNQACLMPRSSSDLQPLPDPHFETPFDSSWEVLLSECSSDSGLDQE